MKSALYTLILFVTFLLCSCGINSSIPFNSVNTTTTVDLKENNFKVVAEVSGESSATYIFGIGGLSNRALINLAKKEMLSNANLVGKSRAIINVNYEIHHSLFVPFFYSKRVIASAHVVEFLDK
jgi:hypothetical protein